MGTTTVSRQGRAGTRRPLWFAFMSAVVSLLAVFIGAAAPIPLYNTYRAADGFTNADISLTIVVYALSVLIALLTTGRLSNHLGRRTTAIASLILLLAAFALFIDVHSIGTLLAARALTGLGAGIASSNVTAYVVDAAPARPAWLTTVASSQLPMLGLAIGAVVSGTLVQFGPAPRQLIYALAGLVAVLGIVLIALSPETVRRTPGVWRSLRPRLRLPSHVVPLLPVAAMVLLATWATASFYQAFVPSVVEEQLHTRSPLLIGLVFACYMAPSAFGASQSGRFSPARAQRLGMIGFLIGMIGIVTAIVTGALALFIVATIIAGVSQGVAISASTRALLFGSTVTERAPIFSVIYVISYCASAIPSLLAGVLSNTFSLEQIAVGYGVLALLSTIVTVVAARNPDVEAAAPKVQDDQRTDRMVL